MRHMIPSMQTKMGAAMNIPKSALVQPVLGSGVNIQEAARGLSRRVEKDAAQGNVERNQGVKTIEKPKIIRLWNLEGATNLQCTGWMRDPDGGSRFFLSNGRELPAWAVVEVNPYLVLLKDGTWIPMADVKNDLTVEEFGAGTMAENRPVMPVKRSRPPIVVMSPDAAGVKSSNEESSPLPTFP